MKSETDWEQEVIKITLKINEEYPELTKYIKEVPVRFTEKSNKEKACENLEAYYNSLEGIIKSYSKTHDNDKQDTVDHGELKSSAYPYYPESEDIYTEGKKEMELDPADLSKNKTPNEKSFDEDKSGDDLDVPGADLDDEQERIGNEDEENNYYSIGGDKHSNLDEN